MFAAAFGLGLGSLAGLSVGPYIFSPLLSAKDYSKQLDESADTNDDELAPEHGTPVTAEMRKLLEFVEPWACWPDYERVSMINRVLAVMWPSVTKAVMNDVLKQVKAQLEAQVFQKFKFVEDIVLGTTSMKDADFSAWIKDKDFTIGTVPPRVGGMKFYNTSEDEVVLEVPLVWGSNCKFDIGVFVRGGPFRVYVPLEVSNLQFKVEARITIKPLVEEIPCVGGATVSLLKVPHVDLSLKLIKGVDLMALPLVKDAVRFGLKYVLDGMLVYPNSMSFPIMPNFGVPPAAKGALNVKLLRGEGLKDNTTFCVLEVRKGRPMVSQTVSGSTNPEYGEEFNLIIDDFVQQSLKLTVHADELGWNDPKIGVGELAFGEVVASNQDPATGTFTDEVQLADFIKAPMHEQTVTVRLQPPHKKANVLTEGVTKLGSKATSLFRAKGAAAAAAAKELDCGTVYLKVTFLPFFQSSYDDEDEETEAKAKKAKKKRGPVLPSSRSITHKVSDKLKGVLTVHLIRCSNLMGEELNTYVRLLVTDEDADQVQKSRVVLNENNPRWGAKFDFVMVTAGSTLHVAVYDKAGLASSLLSAVNVFSKKKKDEDRDTLLGKLSLPVKDVVRNGSLKDVFTLQDTERGQIELALTWQTCFIAE